MYDAWSVYRSHTGFWLRTKFLSGSPSMLSKLVICEILLLHKFNDLSPVAFSFRFFNASKL